MTRVRVEHVTGSAADFHARELPAGATPVVWHLDVDRPAVVLGSRQDERVLDLAACRAAGVEVVHRRSGGGVVHLVPGEALWIDVLVPNTDPRSTPDIRDSMVWMGERWSEALRSVGLGASVVVHRGAMQHTPWSDVVCFAGIGPGEVLLDGHKLVGISQRRTRWGARFQCSVHLRWDPGALLALLAADARNTSPLPEVATVDPERSGELAAALIATIRDG